MSDDVAITDRVGGTRCARSSLGDHSLALLGRHRQAKHRNLTLPSYIHHGFPRVRQIQSLAMLAAVDLGIQFQGLFRIPGILVLGMIVARKA